MDEIIKRLAGLGLPGIILLILAVASAGSNAAIVSVLTAAGGPFGIVGGIGLLGLVKVIGDMVTDYGIEAMIKAVYSERSKTETLRSLFYEIQDLPICQELKLKLQNHLKSENKKYLPSLRTVNISCVKIENGHVIN
ncbi:hypothetical protein [Sphaerospermopsis torques-reginae]|uniref:Uncharacterized protein n=1 Tax=Sphaerospermopsis torques-reginae ITEP-024 TaxID=984208 RepID=A0A1L4BMJ2_9CYAN|nr:hypothetical protein [Sphaerospermopsis torques-reginae]API83192.1 hypothetical protein [Sphaerospermopsis torques-reginae ITEP-024]